DWKDGSIHASSNPSCEAARDLGGLSIARLLLTRLDRSGSGSERFRLGLVYQHYARASGTQAPAADRARGPNSQFSSRSHVMAGMGLALISRHTIGLELALGMMTVLSVKGFPLMRSWFVAHRRHMPLLPVHTRLRSFLLETGQDIINELENGYTRIG